MTLDPRTGEAASCRGILVDLTAHPCVTSGSPGQNFLPRAQWAFAKKIMSTHPRPLGGFSGLWSAPVGSPDITLLCIDTIRDRADQRFKTGQVMSNPSF